MPGGCTEVVVPLLERLMEVRGTIDAKVHDLTFRGITFSHATWLRPSSELGHIDIQANFTPDPDPDHGFWRNSAFTMIHNQNLKSPGAVLVSARQSVAFERCSFNQLGGAGLDIANGAQQNRVIGSRFFNVSGNGIQVGDVLAEDHHPSDPRSVAPVAQGVYLDEGSGYSEVTDNLIYGVSDPVHLNNYQGVRNGT